MAYLISYRKNILKCLSFQNLQNPLELQLSVCQSTHALHVVGSSGTPKLSFYGSHKERPCLAMLGPVRGVILL